jgi:predicted negative regulator of RcsB-dependent stress response
MIKTQLKYLIHSLIVILLITLISSCQTRRDANEAMVEADSLLANGVIMRDTAALATVIQKLDNPIGRIFKKDKLAKAYYLMGRNLDDNYHEFADAADYYIKADRLKTKDYVLRGRINSCMGYLCKQDSCFEEALVFYERANVAFAKTGNDKRYANGLISIAEQYVNLNEYDKADSVLCLAGDYEMDSAYYADIVDIKAMALYNQQLYDSALVYLLSIKDYPRNIEARCFSYKLIMRCYYDMNKVEFAIPYAEYIIQQSTNLNYRSSAYCVLLDLVELINDINQLTHYSNEREDNDRLLRHTSEAYAQASTKVKEYLNNPTPYRKLYIAISVFVALIIIIGLITYLIYRRYQHTLKKQEEEKQKKIQLFERRVFDNSIYFLASSKVWDNTNKLKELANNYFNNMFYRLEEIDYLTEHDKIICLMILLEFSNKEMASIMHVQPNTISKAKKKIAKDIGIASADIRAFLFRILA